LIPTSIDDSEAPKEVPVGQVSFNPYQPRQDFDDAKLEELAQSIRQHGVIQPIVVRKGGGEAYELVAGERRLRAAKLAGLNSIPAVVGEFSDTQLMEVALVENLQREDLNPVEEAFAYQTLLEEFGLTQEQLAKRIGKSRPHIANTVRLLNLPEAVQALVTGGQLTAGHARAVLSLEQPELQEAVAQKIVAAGLSVRETEKLVQKEKEGNSKANSGETEREKTSPAPDPELMLLKKQLQQALGTPVRITRTAKKGTIHIDFYGQDDLARIFEKVVGIEEPL
jgi:ParB family chromosome partitioning protein